MKILFIHDTTFYQLQNDSKSFYSSHINNSDIERYLQFGDNVTFLGRVQPHIDEDENKVQILNRDKSQVISVPNVNSFSGILRLYSIIQIIKKAIEKHDIIVIRLSSSLGFLALFQKNTQNKVVIVEVVSNAYEALKGHSFKGAMLAQCFDYLQRRAIKKSKYCIYVTQRYLQKKYPSYGLNISCSDVVLKDAKDEVLIKRLNKIQTLGSKFIIGTVGALNIKYKGQIDVLKAISELKGEPIEYWLAGPGEPADLLKNANKLGIEDQVKIFGLIDHDSLSSFYDGIDLYIHPSHTEGLPRVIIEAMNRACPVVASNVGGVPELVKEEYLFGKESVGEIMNILKNRDNLNFSQMAKENFETSKQYLFENLERKRLAFFKEVLSQHISGANL